MALYRRIKPDPETLAIELASAAFRETRSQATARPGSVYIPNGDGTATIIGPAAGHDETGGSQGVAPWVGDTTPPGRPTGVTATSAWGIVYVTWAGTLEGGVPADFDHVSVLVDGSEVAQMSRQGTVAVEGLPAGATVTVTLVAYDDAHARDGSPSPNASEPSEPVTATVSDERAEIDQSVQDANDRADALQQEMTDVKATVNGVEQDVSELTTKVSGAVEKADQSLSVATEAKQTADAVSTTASRAYEDAQSALTQSSSALQTAQQLKTTVEEDYLSKDEATGTYASRSDVTQAKDQILSEVSEGYQSKDGMSSYYTKTEVDQKNDAITSTVSTAQSTADSALSKASTVEQTAEGLTVRLDSAEGDIGLAQAAASNAQHAASTAQSTANAASTKATQAQSAASSAQSAASSASSKADSAQDAADAAKTEAQTAQALANTAKTAAETAQGTATSALGTANRAQSAASAAQGAADDAAKVATNFLGFSSEGLVVGDQRGSSLGKNVLIDAESLSIRDGSKVLASFEDDSISLADGNDGAGIYLCGRRAQLTYVAGSGMRLDGTGLDVDGSLNADMLVSRGVLNVGAPMYLGDGRRTGIRCFVQGTVVVTISGGMGTLFTSSQYQSLVGRAYKSGDCVLVCNGDRNANALGPIASCNPSSGTWYVNVPTAASGSASYRVNYVIVAVA